MKTNFIKVLGLKICSIETNLNEPKTLLILHGWGASSYSWNNVINLLQQEKIRIIAVDLPGFGQSEMPKSCWTISDYSNFLGNFLNAAGLKKIYLLGHSFGGQIAAKFAYDYPEKLEKLFLVGAAAIRPKQNMLIKTAKIIAKILKPLMPDKLRRTIYKIFGNLDYGKINNPVLKQILINAVNDDLKNILPHIKAPTIIIWGRQDTYTRLKQGRLINKLIPNSIINILENARHGVHLQQPEKLADIIRGNL